MHLFKDIYLPKSLVARHLAVGLGLAPGGVVLENFVRVGFYVTWLTWEASNTGKHILIFVQEIFFCQWKRVRFVTYIIQFQALRGWFSFIVLDWIVGFLYEDSEFRNKFFQREGTLSKVLKLLHCY